MSILNYKSGGLLLISAPQHAQSHRIRLICQAKDLEIEYQTVNLQKIPEELLEINPHGRIPMLMDKYFVLVNERVISEYLDERFPHPALMPIEANQRAIIRLFCYELESICYSAIDLLQSGKLPATKKKATQTALRDTVVLFSEMLGKKDSLIGGNEPNLLDCCLLPILWRLEYFDVDLPKSATALTKYMEKQFAKPFFQNSLTSLEKKMR